MESSSTRGIFFPRRRDRWENSRKGPLRSVTKSLLENLHQAAMSHIKKFSTSGKVNWDVPPAHFLYGGTVNSSSQDAFFFFFILPRHLFCASGSLFLLLLPSFPAGIQLLLLPYPLSCCLLSVFSSFRRALPSSPLPRPPSSPASPLIYKAQATLSVGTVCSPL